MPCLLIILVSFCPYCPYSPIIFLPLLIPVFFSVLVHLYDDADDGGDGSGGSGGCGGGDGGFVVVFWGGRGSGEKPHNYNNKMCKPIVS